CLPAACRRQSLAVLFSRFEGSAYESDHPSRRTEDQPGHHQPRLGAESSVEPEAERPEDDYRRHKLKAESHVRAKLLKGRLTRLSRLVHPGSCWLQRTLREGSTARPAGRCRRLIQIKGSDKITLRPSSSPSFSW